MNIPAIEPEPVIVGDANVLFVNVCVFVNWTILLFVILAIFVAVSAFPVKLPVTLPVKSPVNIPAIEPNPVIVGAVNVLFVNVCVFVNWTILLFVILAIFVAVSEFPVTLPFTLPVTLPIKLPVTSPVKLPVNTPAIEPNPVIVGALNILFVNVCDEFNWTILLLVILAIFVAVSAFPVKLPVNTPAIEPVPVIVGDVNVLFVNVCDVFNWTILLLVILAIFVAVSAFPVKLPVNTPAIEPVPVIVGDVNVLFVNVCIVSNWTISLFVILAIFVAVSALPVKSPVTLPVTFPVKSP